MFNPLWWEQMTIPWTHSIWFTFGYSIFNYMHNLYIHGNAYTGKNLPFILFRLIFENLVHVTPWISFQLNLSSSKLQIALKDIVLDEAKQSTRSELKTVVYFLAFSLHAHRFVYVALRCVFHRHNSLRINFCHSFLACRYSPHWKCAFHEYIFAVYCSSFSGNGHFYNKSKRLKLACRRLNFFKFF